MDDNVAISEHNNPHKHVMGAMLPGVSCGLDHLSHAVHMFARVSRRLTMDSGCRLTSKQAIGGGAVEAR